MLLSHSPLASERGERPQQSPRQSPRVFQGARAAIRPRALLSLGIEPIERPLVSRSGSSTYLALTWSTWPGGIDDPPWRENESTSVTVHLTTGQSDSVLTQSIVSSSPRRARGRRRGLGEAKINNLLRWLKQDTLTRAGGDGDGYSAALPSYEAECTQCLSPSTKSSRERPSPRQASQNSSPTRHRHHVPIWAKEQDTNHPYQRSISAISPENQRVYGRHS